MKKSIIMMIAIVSLCVLMAGCSVGSKEAAYPSKQIELIVPFAAGGGTDSVARALAEAMKTHLSKPIGVVNKTGGAGAVGMNEGAKAKPNGYTLTMVTVDMSILTNMGLASFSTDDFRPVARINADPAAITVKADAPWNTLDEFIAYAKANPGKVRVGNGGKGDVYNLAAVAFGDKVGAEFNHVPFDGAAPAVTALLGGHIEAVAVSPAEVGAQVEAGQLKMLGIMAEQRLDKFKNVPTLKENGIDLVMGTWRGVAVPKDTPQEVVDVLETAIEQAVKEQSYIDILNKLSLGIVYDDDKKFSEVIKSDNAYFSDILDKLGLKK